MTGYGNEDGSFIILEFKRMLEVTDQYDSIERARQKASA